MDKATSFIEELQKLVSSEYYQEALARFTERSAGILRYLSHSPIHKKLLLLAAQINIGNYLTREAERYMDQLADEYPGIENDFDFVIQKVQIFQLQSDYDNCTTFLNQCQKNNWRAL